ncbi:MAG TPA: hypothetical protein VFY10_15755, partial [Dehalococcoidia bacterium]|nr:hypothetical protein [Dehalococcoidia bacterium]
RSELRPMARGTSRGAQEKRTLGQFLLLSHQHDMDLQADALVLATPILARAGGRMTQRFAP